MPWALAYDVEGAVIRGPPREANRHKPVMSFIDPKGEAVKKLVITAGLIAACAGLTVACSGAASADPIVIVNESNTSSSGSTDCLPASVLDQLPPWLLLGSVPACP